MELDIPFFETSPSLLAVADFNGNFVQVNPAWRDALGYDPAELAGVPFLDFIYPDDHPRVEAVMAHLALGNTVHDFIVRMRHRNGDLRSYAWHISARGRHMFAAGVDSTEEEALRKELVLSERWLDVLFNASDEGIVFKSPDGSYGFANDAAKRMMGIGDEQIQGKTSLFPEHQVVRDDLSVFPKSEYPTERVRRTRKEVRDVEMGLYSPATGSYRWFSATAQPVYREGEMWIRASFVDITAARAATKYAATIRRAIDAHAIVSITDEHGRIIEANDKFCEISGYRREQLVGRNHRIIRSGHHKRGFFKEMWETITSGQTWQGEICNKTQSGEPYWVLTTVMPFTDGQTQEARYLGIRTDITNQKRNERAARAANEAKSRFLANMSHEIRTPLAAIIGMSDLAQETSTNPDLSNMLAKIEQQGETLLSTLNSILDYAKLESGTTSLHPVMFDVQRLAGEVVELFSAAAWQRGIELRTASGDVADIDDTVIYGDENSLRQVLNNLVGNAVKFCSEGDTVSVTVRRVPIADQERIHISVRDSGPGIPAKKQGAIFRAFGQVDSSTTRSHEGTGLGLSISSELVALMGGELTVDSVPDLGAEFSFSLPIGAEPGSGERGSRQRPTSTLLAAATVPDGFKPADYRVLVVDDSPVNREVAVQMLARAGFEVQEAAGGIEGVATAVNGTFDVVLMDIQMPDIDGFEAARRIRRLSKTSSPAIVAVSASAGGSASSRELCLRAGMNEYLTKPFRREELIAVVVRMIEDGRRGQLAQLDQRSATSSQPTPGSQSVGEILSALEDATGAGASSRTFLELYATELHTAHARLDPSANPGSDDEIAASVHRLKGASFSVGGSAIANLCEQVEQALTTGQNREAALDELRRTVTSFAVDLDSYLAPPQSDAPAPDLPGPGYPGASAHTWATGLDSLRCRLAQDEFVPPVDLELLAKQLPTGAAQWFADLRASITQIDYDAARAALEAPPACLSTDVP